MFDFSQCSDSYNLRDSGPSGGLIFYDKGDCSGGWRYMEAAPSDQSSGIQWGGFGTMYGISAVAVGTGKDNTASIVIAIGTGTAAYLCADLNIAGFTDWFLPSLDEIALMNVNLKQQGVGSFTTNNYWSSSETDASNSRTFDFSTNTPSNAGKSGLNFVRAARRF